MPTSDFPKSREGRLGIDSDEHGGVVTNLNLGKNTDKTGTDGTGSGYKLRLIYIIKKSAYKKPRGNQERPFL